MSGGLRIPTTAGRDDWETPAWLFDMLHAEFDFTVDAAAADYNHRLSRYWTVRENALVQDWSDERLFFNPPFDRQALMSFAKKGYESREIAVGVMLTPVKSDQAWWHSYAIKAEVRFVKGRVQFRGADGHYALPVAILVWGAGTPGLMTSIDPTARQPSLFETGRMEVGEPGLSPPVRRPAHEQSDLVHLVERDND